MTTPDDGEAGFYLAREATFVRSDLPAEWNAAVERPGGIDGDVMVSTRLVDEAAAAHDALTRHSLPLTRWPPYFGPRRSGEFRRVPFNVPGFIPAMEPIDLAIGYLPQRNIEKVGKCGSLRRGWTR